MWPVALALTISALVAYAMRPKRAAHRVVGTLVDAPDADTAVALVRALDRGDGADALVERLARVLETFPPDERVMRRLSLMQQACQGEGGLREFCVTTVYAVATEVCSRPLKRPSPDSPRCFTQSL